MAVTIDDEIAEVRRELHMRRTVFPSWISKGFISQADADQRNERLASVLDTLIAERARRAQLSLFPDDNA